MQTIYIQLVMNINEINGLPLIDDDQIAMLVEAGEDAAAELIRELLDLFKAESIPHLDGLKSSLADANYSAVSRVAHALAGSSANLGGLRLAKLSKAIEHAGDVQDGATIKRLAQGIDTLFLETVQGFEAEITRIEATA